MSGRTILGHSFLFFLGNVLPQVAGLVLLPLYTHYLTPAEFGVLEILNRLGELLIICLLFNGLRQAVLVFTGQHSAGGNRDTLGPSVLTILVGVVVVGVLVGWLCRPAVQFLIPHADPALSLLALTTVLVEAAAGGLLGLAQARMQSGLFLCCVAAQVLLRTLGCAALLAGAGLGLWGVLLASLAASGLVFAALGLREIVRGPWNLTPVPHLLRFALPFVPAGLGFFVLNHGDRFLLLRVGGAATVGVYALGYKAALAVSMFSRAPLMMAWGPRAYQLADAPHAPVLFGQVFARILGAYLLVGLGCCLFQDEVIAVLGPPDYAPAAQVIGPVVLAYLFLAAADFMDCSFYIRRKTLHKSLVAVATTAVMLSSYCLLIPHWFILGAAVATLVGFAFHAGLTLLLAQRLYRIHYPFPRVLGMVALAILAWATSRWLPAGLAGVLVKSLLWVGWAGLVWGLGFVTAEEKAWVSGALRLRVGAVRSTVRRVLGIAGQP